MLLVLLVAVSAMPVIIMVVVAIDTISAVALSSYANIRSYPLALSATKSKSTSPLSLSGSI
jgi:hypothetical protein